MRGFYLYAAIAITISAISFPAAALMFDATPTAFTGPLAAAPLALSPKGSPVRIISLSPGKAFAQAAAASMQSNLSGPVAWEWAPPPEPKLVLVPKGQAAVLVIRRAGDHTLVLVSVEPREAHVSEGRPHGEPP